MPLMKAEADELLGAVNDIVHRTMVLVSAERAKEDAWRKLHSFLGSRQKQQIKDCANDIGKKLASAAGCLGLKCQADGSGGGPGRGKGAGLVLILSLAFFVMALLIVASSVALVLQRIAAVGRGTSTPPRTRPATPRAGEGVLDHVAWMLDNMPRRSNTLNFHRWLGSVQGILWITSAFTVTELRRQTREPMERPVVPRAPSHTMDSYSAMHSWRRGSFSATKARLMTWSGQWP